MPETKLTESGLQRRVKQHLQAQPQSFFAPCAIGFESVLFDEVSTLPGVASVKKDEGGILFDGPFDLVYAANLRLRTAHRILMRIDEFRVSSYPELFNKLKRTAWERYLGFSPSVSFEVTAKTSRLHHTDNIAKAAFDAIVIVMEKEGLVINHDEKSPLRIFIRLKEDCCTISIDSSGEHLHKRGWRVDTGHAPIRETLAVGLLSIAGADTADAIVDPLCGSGTFCIEAAHMRSRTAPGLTRSFAFETWPSFQEKTFAFVKKQILAERMEPSCAIHGSDNDNRALACAERNRDRALCTELIHLEKKDCRSLDLSSITAERGLIIANLPYGKRVGDERTIGALHREFGAALKKTGKGWRYCLVLGDEQLIPLLGFKPEKTLRFRNGGLPVVTIIGRIL